MTMMFWPMLLVMSRMDRLEAWEVRLMNTTATTARVTTKALARYPILRYFISANKNFKNDIQQKIYKFKGIRIYITGIF
jgi:hypothetical protein